MPDGAQQEHHDHTRGLHVIAAFEAFKGVLVLLLGSGLLSLGHSRILHLVERLVRHFHLNPASGITQVFVDLARDASDTRLRWVAFVALAYASLRFAEAYGLWLKRTWAEWLAVISASIYIPFEVYELAIGISFFKLATLLINIAIIAYVGRALIDALRMRKA